MEPSDQRAPLRPTLDQYHAFGTHLCEAHSWYKHLPLMTGGQFVVFVARDAGIGRLELVGIPKRPGMESAPAFALVAAEDSREFTEEHPRLHHTWRTTQEYRRRFGYLEYMYRLTSQEPYSRDAGPPIQVPADLEKRFGFVLYPYVSENFIEAVTWPSYAKIIERIKTSANHPSREEVLKLARLAAESKAACDRLTSSESELAWTYRRDRETPLSEALAVNVKKYLELDRRVEAAYRPLRAQEMTKMWTALAALDDWLLDGV